MIQRVTAEGRVQPTEMVTFQIGKVEVVQPRTAKRAVRWQDKLFPFRVIHEQRPLPLPIDFEDLVGGDERAVFGDAREGYVEIVLHIKRHAVWQGGKVLRVDLSFAKGPIFLESN